VGGCFSFTLALASKGSHIVSQRKKRADREANANVIAFSWESLKHHPTLKWLLVYFPETTQCPDFEIHS
jgi:hypothetical protein